MQKINKPVIIMIGGKARNGKGEVAKEMTYLADKKGLNTITVGLADYLKWVCNHYAGVPIEGHSEDQRFVWQYFGTDVVKASDRDHWVREMEFMIRKMNQSRSIHWDYIFIPDFRFPNESDFFANHGYKVYTVEAIREGASVQLSKEEAAHSSENSLNDFQFDFIITAASMGELKEQTDKIWEQIRDRR